MKLTKHLVVLSLTIIMSVLSVSCAQNKIVALDSTLEPTETYASMSAPEETPIITPSLAPTATPIFSEKRTAELNQQIYDFNHNEGDFTKEKKSEMAISTQTTEERGSTELGIQLSQPRIEGYFFDYFEKDGSLILLMGFDDKNGKGFTTPIQIPLYFYEGEALAKFTFAVKTSSYLGTVETVTNKDTEGLFIYLDKLKGKVIMVQPAFKPFPGTKDDHTGATKEYFIEHESKVAMAGKLISLVATNGIEIQNEDYHESDYENHEIIKIESLDEMNNIDLSMVTMIDPVIIFSE